VADDPKRTKLGVGGEAAKRNADLVGKTVLQRYVIEEQLGAGAMGVVYRGRHTKRGTHVAIKVLHEHLLDEPTMLARFEREAQTAERLRHPNVAGVLEVGAAPDGRLAMVMEFAEGRRLSDVMEESLSRERVINLMRQLLLGLEHAHGVGVVHRDLKPDNVIVGPDDVPRIVDFGIAALRTDDSAEGGRLTATGALLGTPLYIAPEQARGDAIDGRADLFALGVILFEIMAGATPFEGSSLEIVVANMNEDIPPVIVRAPDRTPDPVLEAFMKKLSARDRDKRFSDARAALDVLELVEHDPPAAELALGKTDVARALALISLPEL